MQWVDVLVLVDRERTVPIAHLRGRFGMLVEQQHGEPEHVLEVHAAHGSLPALVAVEDPEHELGGDRRPMAGVFQLVEVAGRGHHPALRPLDLGGQVPSRLELVGRWERVRQGRDQRRLAVEDVAQRRAGESGPQARELGQGRRMERSRLGASHPERRQAGLQLPGRLLREGHGEELGRREGAGGHLVGDAVGDGGGLAGPRPGQDSHRPADGGGRLALLRVQTVEDRLRVGHSPHRTAGL